MSVLKEKSQVIMLPTENINNSLLLRHLWKNTSNECKSLWQYNQTIIIDGVKQYTTKGGSFRDCVTSFKPQHLYIVSDEEIQEGDWVLNTSSNEIYQCNDTSKSNQYKHNKKIIATTDTSLRIEASYKKGLTIQNTTFLPQSSQGFIEKYIKEYNNGNIITDILVEYWDNRDYNPSILPDVRLKVKDNTIIIHSIKDSWNKEEVSEKIKEFAYSGYSKEQVESWIKKNL